MRPRCRGYLLILATVLLALICGCGPRKAATRDQGITLQFWNGFSGPDGTTMERIVRQFNAEHPGIKVRMQIIPWGTYYDKVTLGLAYGGAPDVFVLHCDALPRYADSSSLSCLNDLVAQGDLTADDFTTRPWQASQWKGKQYAIPLDCHPQGLYYNVDLFKKAGIVDEHGNAKPPSNLQEFLHAAKKLTVDRNGDGRPDQWGFVFTWMRTNYVTFLSQHGGSWLSEDCRRSTLNAPESLAALNLMTDLVDKYKVAPRPEGQDAWIGFQTGKVAMALEGIYMLSSLEQQEKLNFAGAPCPMFGKQRGAWASSHLLVMPAKISPEKRRAGWAFIKYLSDHSLEWAKGGQVPVRKSILASPGFKKLSVQYEFSKQLAYVAYLPASISINQVIPFADAAVEGALCGIKPAHEALEEAHRRTSEVLERE